MDTFDMEALEMRELCTWHTMKGSLSSKCKPVAVDSTRDSMKVCLPAILYGVRRRVYTIRHSRLFPRGWTLRGD